MITMEESTAKLLKQSTLTNLNSLSTDERKAIAEKTYLNENYFQRRFSSEEFDIDIKDYSQQFIEHIQRIIFEKNILDKLIPLENLHDHLSDEMKAYDFAHGLNKISAIFYETDALFNKTYLRFIRHIRSTIISEPFYFQSTPTIRVHCPNAVNASLYPRYHTDICYGHPPEEVNIWIPLTKKLDGHGFSLISLNESNNLMKSFNFDYVEFIDRATYDRVFSKQCQNISHPVETELGSALFFDPRCIHSGEPLKTHTRVSIDLRIITVNNFRKLIVQHQGSGRLRILFEPGACYNQLTSDEI